MGLVLLVDLPEAKQDVHQIMNGNNVNGVTNESKHSRVRRWGKWQFSDTEESTLLRPRINDVCTGSSILSLKGLKKKSL
jgi:hypothetical protein